MAVIDDGSLIEEEVRHVKAVMGRLVCRIESQYREQHEWDLQAKAVFCRYSPKCAKWSTLILRFTT